MAIISFESHLAAICCQRLLWFVGHLLFPYFPFARVCVCVSMCVCDVDLYIINIYLYIYIINYTYIYIISVYKCLNMRDGMFVVLLAYLLQKNKFSEQVHVPWTSFHAGPTHGRRL